ncbi:MAG: hypothetical protein U0804_27715 [Gemmataceae bacterium]
MANLADITERHVLTDDSSFYVQNACVTDPTLASEEEHAVRAGPRDTPAPERGLEA